MTRFSRSACIEWLFAEDDAPVTDRIRRAAEAGLDGVEFWHWRDKDLEAVGEAAHAGGLAIVMMLVEPQVPIVDARRLAEFAEAAEESARAAATLGCATLVVASGERLPEVPVAEQDTAIVAALRAGGEIAGRHGLTLLFEPLNDTDHPHCFVTGTDHGLRLVDEAGLQGVKLLYDVYHSAVMGEDPGVPIAGKADLIGHVHVADHVGRHEPGTGVIDWSTVLRRLNEAGYSGYVGLEYRPTANSVASLAYLEAAMA
ncbi:TIM barrel protein [Solirubrobacter ginsenosidimutans]|uniref:TIM barrel protein n=1 Tax=Solirubrobacter ginsenosidimutans TaxID=490573 RepID=A0A9X3MN73_9ACTN|nr:TIM barrel protein [Solirubrobacter ginsenosidimutans]MDA0158827.1 TIM barrel protein [Solirubrobacter ginsenosidimutans]